MVLDREMANNHGGPTGSNGEPLSQEALAGTFDLVKYYKSADLGVRGGPKIFIFYILVFWSYFGFWLAKTNAKQR